MKHTRFLLSFITFLFIYSTSYAKPDIQDFETRYKQFKRHFKLQKRSNGTIKSTELNENTEKCGGLMILYTAQQVIALANKNIPEMPQEMSQASMEYLNLLFDSFEKCITKNSKNNLLKSSLINIKNSPIPGAHEKAGKQ